MDMGKSAITEVVAAERRKPGTIEALKKGKAKVAEVRNGKPAAPAKPKREPDADDRYRKLYSAVQHIYTPSQRGEELPGHVSQLLARFCPQQAHIQQLPLSELGGKSITEFLVALRQEITIRREKARARREQSKWNSDNTDTVEMRHLIDYVERELDWIPIPRSVQPDKNEVVH